MKIVHYPHPSLKHPAKPVTTIDKDLRLNVGKMFELMYEARGVGLAATQVALPFQLLVMNMEADPNNKDAEEVYLNPQIVERKGVVDDEEGCLSFPGLFVRVKRAKKIVVAAYNLKGEEVRIEATGFHARAWQHEIDHLDGIVFIERFSEIARRARADDIRDFEVRFRRAQETGEIPPDADIERTLKELEKRMLGGADA